MIKWSKKMDNEIFESWTKWKSDDVFRMWPRQDTGVNRRPSQTNYITILEAILTAFLGQNWKFQEQVFNIHVRCLTVWRIIFEHENLIFTLWSCGLPKTFQQNKLFFFLLIRTLKTPQIKAFCSPWVGCATLQGWRRSQ